MKNTKQLNRPSKIEQAAALMLTVLKANPNAALTRREIESLVNVSEFSVSTQRGALNWLCSQGHIRWETVGLRGYPIAYRMPLVGTAAA